MAPGGEATSELRVHNEGTAEERFRFQVRGDAATWVSVNPFALSVAPGADATAQILFRPPRTPVVRAGDHRVEISIRLVSDSTTEALASVEVAVSAFEEVGTRLDPDPSGPSGRFLLRVDNKGNAVLRASVAAAEATPAASISATPASLSVDPGTSSQVQVDVEASRRLFGAGDGQSFSVSVTPEGSAPIVCSGTARPPARLSRRTVAALAAAAVVVVLVAVLAATTLFSSSSRSPSAPSAPSKSKPEAGAAAPVAQTCPGAGHLAHDANGQIRQNVLEPDNYSFLFEKPGGCLPIRWNPCAPIHYVVNAGSATAAQIADVEQAVADNAQATGLQYIDDGTTTAPAQDWQPDQPTRYPGQWAPVLIQWTHLGGQNSLTEVAGGGVPFQVSGVYVSGIITLNLDAHLLNNVQIPDGFGSGVTWGRIILHELGHLVGLGHVTGVEEIMHEPVTDQTSPSSAYGFGDLAGLRLLGRTAGCLTTPPVSTAANFGESGSGARQ